jgi:hypothetical protein
MYGTEHHAIAINNMQPAAREPLPVLNQEESSAAGEPSLRNGGGLLRDADDASRKEFRKCPGIAISDLRVQELGIRLVLPGSMPARRADAQPFAQGTQRTARRPLRDRFEGKNPRLVVIYVFVNQCRIARWKNCLEPGNIVENHAKYGQPVDETIAGQAAQCEQLMNAGAKTPVLYRVVKIGWNVEPIIIGKQTTRPACNFGEGQSSRS